MSALEQEIIERLKHLSHDAQLRVLEVVKQAEEELLIAFDDNGEEIMIEEHGLDEEEWLAQMKQLREQIKAESDGKSFPSPAEMMREIREEEA